MLSKDDSFKVAVLKPPMIYGKGCKGNYPRLAGLAKTVPIFPNINNQRSMLYIDNLCELVRLIIDNNDNGIFYPQNDEYVNTADLVRLIAEAHGRKIKLVKFLNPLIRIFINMPIINKVFGDLVYEKSLSDYEKNNYRIKSFKESIMLTELGSDGYT